MQAITYGRARLPRIAIPVVLIALLAACGKTMAPLEEPNDPAVPDSVRFRLPVPDDEHEASAFAFTVLEAAITISVDGAGRVVQPHAPPGEFRVPLAEGDSIETFYYAAYGDDMVLFLQISDGHYVGSRLVRLNPRTGKVKWNTPVYAFNIGEPLAVGPMLYVTTFGFVGKFDLESGRFLWRHENLYDDGVYNAFQKPMLTRSGTVIFRESSWDRSDEKALYLIVRDSDGAILRKWDH